MIWGMTLEPGKLYTEIMGEEVQLSMAAIDSRKDLDEKNGETPSTNFCQIVIQTEKGEYVLCTLVHGVMFQQNLDLKLMPREKVTFSVQGPSVVYLVGYTASYPEDEEGMGMQQEEYEEDSSAWESFQEGDPALTHIKEEPVEILDDSDTEIEDNNKDEVQGQIAALAQEHTEGAITGEPPKDSGEDEETIFSVAGVDPTVVKTEPPDRDAGPVTQQQLPPQDEMYGMQTTDHGIDPTQTTTAQDFFYPDPQQQQSDVALTPPVGFQPITSGPEYQNPQPAVLPQTGVLPQTAMLPSTETFLQTQSPIIQRAQHGSPIRHSSPGARGNLPSANIQRNYPPQRRQYGSPRGKSPGRGRKPRSTNQPQNRNMQQQPGTSQQGIPGPSTSGEPPLLPSAEHPISQVVRGTFQGTPSKRQRSSMANAEYLQSSSRPELLALSKSRLPASSPDRGGFCRICGKHFPSLDRLRSHEIYHDRSARYPCPLCKKSFASKTDKTRHLRTHTGEKPFKCSSCGRGFSEAGSMRRHELRVHSLSRT